MRAYSASSEETLRARDLLKDWAGEGLLTEAQHHQMEQETGCELRRTNIFLRLVLFLFTLIIVGAAVGLFVLVFLSHAPDQSTGIFLLFAAVISYAAAELAVSKARLYRFGIEEALAAGSVAFLCVGMMAAFFRGSFVSSYGAEFLVPVAGAVVSLWLRHRFGFPYASLVAMIFVAWLPRYWTASYSAQHLILTVLYAVGLLTVAALRGRYRFTHLNNEYSITEALLWLFIYLTINLQLSPATLTGQWFNGSAGINGFSRPFYWATWLLTWCLPPIVLARGVRQKDRFVIAVGGIAAILTLATNKLYLGWTRHTWDPMLLGVLLIGVAIFIRRWLANGPGGIRHGFTAQRLSGKDKTWMTAASTAMGVVSPNTVDQSTQTNAPEARFGGGASGGGGATADF